MKPVLLGAFLLCAGVVAACSGGGGADGGHDGAPRDAAADVSADGAGAASTIVVVRQSEWATLSAFHYYGRASLSRWYDMTCTSGTTKILPP